MTESTNGDMLVERLTERVIDELLTASPDVVASLLERHVETRDMSLGQFKATVEAVHARIASTAPLTRSKRLLPPTGCRRVYLDTEFVTDNYQLSGLISIGLTDDRGRDYYAVNGGMAVLKALRKPFLREHVFPHLPIISTPYRPKETVLDADHPDVKTPLVIRDEITTYMRADPRPVWLYSWYGADDVKRLHWLWRNNWAVMPPEIPQWAGEIQELVALLGDPELPHQTNDAHHALNDAWYHRAIHEYLLELAQTA